ncbi:MAG: RES domain-containing protein, partial [Bacteroidota bacterium]|nr:RES domain-containing protein [Bacteroidota bacterium]
MNDKKVLSFNEFKRRVKKLQRIPNHLTKVHTSVLINNQYYTFTEDDLYPVHPIFKEFPKPYFDTSLYRVTTQFSGLDETNISFFHHPHSAITNLNRCNMPKFPVFYCSEDAETSLIECVSKELPIANAVYYISEWKVKTQRTWRTEVFMLGELPSGHPMKKVMDNV